jgi:hypothetical protein
MKLQPFDRKAYDAWVKKVEDLLPAHIACPDCNGTGEGECPHCGSWTDCETCGGDKTVRPSQVITLEFYRRVMIFEARKLEHWSNGDPIATKDEKGRVVENHNPLSELARELRSDNLSSLSTAPRIVLRLPITERPQ